MPIQHLLIGISGLICSGKSTFAHLLARYTGADVVSFRSFFQKEAIRKGVSISRRNLDAISDEFLRNEGLTVAVEGVLALRKEDGLLILDGVRMVETISCIEKKRDWLYTGVFVEANWEIRATRLEQRQEKDLARWELHEYDEKLMSQGLRTLTARAEWNIVNEGSLDDLAAQALQVATDIQKIGVSKE